MLRTNFKKFSKTRKILTYLSFGLFILSFIPSVIYLLTGFA
jgi:hypothetical protein